MRTIGRSTLNPAVYVLCALIDVRGYTQSGHVGQKQFASNCSGVSNVACSDPSDTCPRGRHGRPCGAFLHRSEEHTSELQSLMRISYAVFCLKKKINT